MKLKMKYMKPKKWEGTIKPKSLNYEASKYNYDFQQYETIRSFGESIYAGKISIHETEMDQTTLLKSMVKFNNKSRPKTKEGKDEEKNTFDSVSALFVGRESTLNPFRSGIFPIKKDKEKD